MDEDNWNLRIGAAALLAHQRWLTTRPKEPSGWRGDIGPGARLWELIQQVNSHVRHDSQTP